MPCADCCDRCCFIFGTQPLAADLRFAPAFGIRTSPRFLDRHVIAVRMTGIVVVGDLVRAVLGMAVEEYETGGIEAVVPVSHAECRNRSVVRGLVIHVVAVGQQERIGREADVHLLPVQATLNHQSEKIGLAALVSAPGK